MKIDNCPHSRQEPHNLLGWTGLAIIWRGLNWKRFWGNILKSFHNFLFQGRHGRGFQGWPPNERQANIWMMCSNIGRFPTFSNSKFQKRFSSILVDFWISLNKIMPSVGRLLYLPLACPWKESKWKRTLLLNLKIFYNENIFSEELEAIRPLTERRDLAQDDPSSPTFDCLSSLFADWYDTYWYGRFIWQNGMTHIGMTYDTTISIAKQ